VEHSEILRRPILDSRKLLAFVTLARCCSFSQTARELFLTQSAVSHAIKSLEDELGCRLDWAGERNSRNLGGICSSTRPGSWTKCSSLEQI
jgi:hypothetical protein